MMQALERAAAVFCTACICAELLSRFVGQGWGQKCIKAVAGLYILVVFADALPGAKAQFTALELPQVSAVSVAVWKMLFWHRRQKNSPVRSKNAVSARRAFRSG